MGNQNYEKRLASQRLIELTKKASREEQEEHEMANKNKKKWWPDASAAHQYSPFACTYITHSYIHSLHNISDTNVMTVIHEKS